MTRKIVYLDHSVLSNLAKGACFVLLETFVKLVEEDRALFPFSWTHHQEAVLSSKLDAAICDVAARLSRGLRFTTPALIAATQARRAYLQFVGRDCRDLSRAEAFEHDPDGDIPAKLASNLRHARVTKSEAGRELSRQNKELFARSLSEERQQRIKDASFAVAKERWAVENAVFYFEEPQRNALQGRITDLVVAMLEYSAFVSEEASEPLGQATLEGTVHSVSSMFDFFRSDTCRTVPFIDIGASIYASLDFDEPTREYLPSDMHDIETWSAYLPYVDIAVADRHMHQVLSRRGLASSYGCNVLPHTEEGLKALIAALG